MDSKPKSASLDIKQIVELYTSYWKWILLSVIIALLLAFTYLRYTTYEYKASATIKIRDEKQSNKLPSIGEMTSEGLFSGGSDKIKDEIKVIQSRSIAENIVKTLNLNIRCFAEGKIKEKELYKNPPIKVSFFESDSVINQVSATLYIKIKSSSEFILFEDDGKSLINRDESDGKIHAFGDKVDTSYGGIVLVPNTGEHKPQIGSNLKLTITPIKKLVEFYQSSVNVITDKGSSVIKLEMKLSVAQKAVDYLNQLILEYNNDVLNDKEEVVKVTSDFITKRLESVSAELEQVDYTAEQLQKKNNLTALSSQADLNLQSNKQLEQQIASTSNNIDMISYLQEEITADDRTSDMLPADIGIGDSSTQQIIRNHNELVAKRNELLRNSSEKNPIVINLNNQINALKANLQGSLSTMKKTSELTLSNLNTQNARIRGQLYNAPNKQRQFRDIERQQGIKESLYLYLLEKREESAIRLGMYSPNAKIIDDAHSSFKPVSPNKTITYLAAFIFGLCLPIGFIYIIDLLDSKIYNKKDLTNITDIPYLGNIPRTPKSERLIKRVDYSPKAEAFRIARSNIDFMLKDTNGRSKKIFITSTKAQEGKSHTSTNLASSISFSDKKVLLIEMDIRVPKILDYLGVEATSPIGLSDYIADKTIKPKDIVVKHKENKNLDIIPSGTIPPNPSELLMSNRIGELFEYFDDKYDYIVVDTSAVGLVSDTLLIADFADMFVYVVSANNVDKRQLVNVAQPLYDDNRLPNMVMLLNGVRKGSKGYGYGYGYGYGNDPSNSINKWYKFW